ncbi:MAG: TrkH family potassium uptake protein [Anaerolineae bacterium]
MRQYLFLRQRYRALIGYIGAIMAMVGLLHLVPLLLLFFYPEEVYLMPAFLAAGMPLIIGGLLFWHFFAPQDDVTITAQEGFVAISLVWISASLWGGVPFIIASDLTLTQAVFESTSGWTTTGLSLVDVTTAPHLILFFRSFLQLAGGAGLAIITLGTIVGPIGTSLSTAEGRADQLVPHVRQTIQIVLRMYLGYIVIGFISLRLAGMTWFDAINHTFTAVATGGFSTRVESIGYWDDPIIEVIVIVLMLLGSINFLVAYTVLRGKWRAVVRNAELRLVALVLPIAAGMIFIFTTTQLDVSSVKALRLAVFEATSALTGTGFSLGSYLPWSDFGWFILILLMLLGGGTGSTSGGIKQFRIYILYKMIRWEIQRAFLPTNSVNEPAIWQGEQRQLLNNERVRQIAIFISFYLFVFMTGSAVFMAYGFPFRDSMFEFASTLGTVGLSVGITTPDLPESLLWVQIVSMLLGRLEFFAVIIGLSKLSKDMLYLGTGKPQSAS